MKKHYLIYDTETSGFASDKIPATDPKQAWIVQFAARLINEDGQTLMTLNVLQQSAGRSINPRAGEVHGITTEMCDKDGVSAEEMKGMIQCLFENCDIAICHNVAFDGKMLDKFGQCFEDQSLLDNIRSTPTFCTMKTTTTLCGLTQKNGRTPKWPKLEELYAHLFNGEEFENAHDAMADVNATYRCFMHPTVQEIFNKR